MKNNIVRIYNKQNEILSKFKRIKKDNISFTYMNDDNRGSTFLYTHQCEDLKIRIFSEYVPWIDFNSSKNIYSIYIPGDYKHDDYKLLKVHKEHLEIFMKNSSWKYNCSKFT